MSDSDSFDNRTMRVDNGRTPADGGSGEAELVQVEGPARGRIVPLSGDRTTIGRLDDNDLVLASPVVSKHHAVLIREGSTFYLEDSGSTNGVLINGTRLARDQRRRLFHGDNVRIADNLLLFRQQRGSFVDEGGTCTICLDHDRVRQEADDFLVELGIAPRAGRQDEPRV